jgi:hypothetical protein
LIETALKVLGGLAAALITIAGAVYGVQRMLRKDDREDSDLSLLGRGKTTIFEQYDGIIKRMETELNRIRAEGDRQATQILNLSTRSVQQESELIKLRQRNADFADMLTTVKKEQRDLLDAGAIERPLIDVNTNILK